MSLRIRGFRRDFEVFVAGAVVIAAIGVAVILLVQDARRTSKIGFGSENLPLSAAAPATHP